MELGRSFYSGFIRYIGVYWSRPYYILIGFALGLLVGILLGVSFVRS